MKTDDHIFALLFEFMICFDSRWSPFAGLTLVYCIIYLVHCTRTHSHTRFPCVWCTNVCHILLESKIPRTDYHATPTVSVCFERCQMIYCTTPCAYIMSLNFSFSNESTFSRLFLHCAALILYVVVLFLEVGDEY